jgi:hypothetical protein
MKLDGDPYQAWRSVRKRSTLPELPNSQGYAVDELEPIRVLVELDLYDPAIPNYVSRS